MRLRPDPAAREPLPPGPRGRILFIGPFNGGIGGMERLTRIFAEWVETSGFTATMVCRHVFPPGPYSVTATPAVRTTTERHWNRRLARAAWDFVYVMPAGLTWKRWVPRLRALSGVKIVLDVDQARHWDDACDVLHCETPRDQPRPRPTIVAPPDPRSTIPPGEAAPERDFSLTAFTPYGRVKGQEHVPAFLASLERSGTDKRLVWCYDPVSFAGRKRRHGREIRARIDALRHPRLELVEAPTQERLYALYRAADDYVCFSNRESFGFSIVDAVALGKPLCSRRVGACRLLDDFRPTEDFARPVFARYDLPIAAGYEGLFREAAEMGAARR